MYEKLRKRRKEKRATVKELIGVLNLKTEAAYFKKETGDVRFTVEEAIALARFLETTVEELFS